MKEGKTALILVSSDPLFDHRAQKIKESLIKMGYSARICGVSRFDKEGNSDDVRWKMKNPKGPRFYFELGRKMIAFIEASPPTLVWACDPDTLWAASWTQKKHPFFLVYDSHEWFSEVPELNGKPWKKWLWNQLENHGAKKSDLCITVSEPIARVLSEKTGKEFQVLMNMPNQHEVEPSTEKKLAILYQGAINQGRRIPNLIAAIENLPEWEVWIAGKGDLENELRSWSGELKHHNRIKWLGMLTKQELQQITSQVKIGYNGLDWEESKSYEYSLANKFFDYIHAGIPVITAPTPTYRDMINQYSVGWLENQSLSELIRKISLNDQDYFKKVTACKMARQIWTWENQWKTIQTLLP
jgi:glycosyltransferase involved in cell wall biosynthesis